MKTFKKSCRKVKISISLRGGNSQFSPRGERHGSQKKKKKKKNQKKKKKKKKKLTPG